MMVMTITSSISVKPRASDGVRPDFMVMEDFRSLTGEK
jgi:hypothetical protein